MLLSCVLGDQSKVSNDWSIVENDYGDKLISNESIKQKIRLGKNVASKCEKVYSSAATAGYDIASNIILTNNNKNMNLNILNFWSKDKEERKKHVDSNICYVTLVSNNYQLLNYETDEVIAQTYRYKGNDDQAAVQGCAIRFDKPGVTLIKIGVFDKVVNRYTTITVDVDDEYKLHVEKNSNLTKEETDVLKDVKKKLGRRMVHFLISCPEGYLPTSTYIVNGLVEGLSDKVAELTDSVKNAQILVLPSGDNSFKANNKEEIQAIKDMFNEHIVNERVKAVTLIGVDLPVDICREFKILYQFKFNEDTNLIECIRSN